LRRLQTVIDRHEDHAFKVRTTMYGLLTALAVALFSNGVSLSPLAFAIVALLIIGFFLLVELVHRAIVRMAIERSRSVEEMIRLPQPAQYDGPRLSMSLQRNGWNDFWKPCFNELRLPWIYVHYFGLVVLIIAIALAQTYGVQTRPPAANGPSAETAREKGKF
jgi:hypothetical protein